MNQEYLIKAYTYTDCDGEQELNIFLATKDIKGLTYTQVDNLFRDKSGYAVVKGLKKLTVILEKALEKSKD